MPEERHPLRFGEHPEGHMYEYQAHLIRVIDGDTLEVRLDLGFRIHLEARLRLARVDAPELGEPAGIVAKSFVTKELHEIDQLRVQTHKTEKYGRWLAEVTYTQRGQPGVWHNLADRLIERGLAQWTQY